MWWSGGEWIIITIGPTAACGIGPRQALLSSVGMRAVSGPKHRCIMEYKSVESPHEHWTNKRGRIGVQQDMDLLQVNEKGLWQEYNPEVTNEK
jgi:hypothetical protein